MRESRVHFETAKSLQECAASFRNAVEASYSGGRRFVRAAGMLRGALMGSDANPGGLEYFMPSSSPFDGLDGNPSWRAGVWVPGYSKLTGPSRMAVHIYVVDHGDKREVQLVGPYGMGDKGSTESLLQSIHSRF